MAAHLGLPVLPQEAYHYPIITTTIRDAGYSKSHKIRTQALSDDYGVYLEKYERAQCRVCGAVDVLRCPGIGVALLCRREINTLELMTSLLVICLGLKEVANCCPNAAQCPQRAKATCAPPMRVTASWHLVLPQNLFWQGVVLG